MSERTVRSRERPDDASTPSDVALPERAQVEPDAEHAGALDAYDTLTEAMELIAQRTSDVEGLLREIAARFRRVLDFECCALALPDDAQRTYRVLTLLETRASVSRAGEWAVPFEVGAAGRIFGDGERGPIVDTSGAPDPMVGRVGIGSMLLVPMLGAAGLLGVVSLGASRRRYDQRDARRARALAVELALAVGREASKPSKAGSPDLSPLLLEEFPTPIWRAGTDSRCDYFNREWLTFTGRTIEEELGEGWVWGVHRDDVEGCLANYQRAFRQREPFVLEYRLRRWDGAFRWVLDYGRPFRGSDGHFCGYIGSCFDITERKVLQMTAEHRFRDLVEGLDAIVWEADLARYRYTFVSRKVEDVLGYPMDLWLTEGDFWLAHVHPDDRARARAAMEAAVTGAGAPTFEYRALAADGRLVWLEDRVRAGRGEARRARGVTVDTTAKKQAETQLVHAQKMEALGRLSGGVAHDFNNILTFILGRCEFAAKRLPQTDPAHHDLQQIRRAAERAAAVTCQLLAFTRRQPAAPTVLDVSAVVADIAEMLRHLIGEHIELTLELDEQPCWVRAVPAEIEQILVNLVVNARDAMASHGELTIETAHVTAGEVGALGLPDASAGPFVRLAVQDTGEGMDVATCARIFEPYFTTKELGQGAGLGLSNVFGAVKGLGGTVRVDSEVGRGARFEILVPSAPTPVEQPPVGRPPEPSKRLAASPAVGSPRRTILFVEDEPDIRDFAREFLEAEGYHVLAAGDGVEALEVAARYDGTIDVMLTDVQMPRMGGPALARQLLEARPGTRVVYTSGYIGVIRDVDTEAMAGVLFLQKPYTPESMASKVREALDLAPSARETAAPP
jgi:PAS domain S-box-containing protein